MRSDINKWILEKGVPIAKGYHGNITIRQLHYRLVAAGMTNDLKHYKKVVSVMSNARWNGEIEFSAFVDRERETMGETNYEVRDLDNSIDAAKRNIQSWAVNGHRLNRWENQAYYPEVFIEKKALQGVFEGPCKQMDVALNPCKGYPSLTFLRDAKDRFENAVFIGKRPIILYFGDYDCSGEDIPRSIGENLRRMGCDVEIKRILLTKAQVVKWKLPFSPTKPTDSRGKTWGGLGQVELDAVEPKKLEKFCTEAIEAIFDDEMHDDLLAREEEERIKFKKVLRRDFKSLLD